MTTSPHNPPSPRELQCLALLADGLTVDEMAHQLHLSPNTVKKHLQNLQMKLRARSRVHAVNLAWQRGLLPVRVT